MSSKSKRKPAPTSRPPADRACDLTAYKAVLMEEPGKEPVVALGLGGVDVQTDRAVRANFVMYPEAARLLIAELQQALPSD